MKMSTSRDMVTLDALQQVDHVVGVARTDTRSDGTITVFLDEENAASRAEIAQWSQATTTPVNVKILGKIVF